MQLTYKFRMYPSKKQEEKLLWTLDQCRFAYNQLLERLNKGTITRNELQHYLLKIKETYSNLKGVYSKTLQYENYRLFSNLKALSKLKKNGKKVGKLRFKGKDWFKTVTYNQTGFKLATKLHLSKIGKIPLKKHRLSEGTIKQITIKHAFSNKWFALITCETLKKPKKTENKKQLGIDLGITNYAFDSDNNFVENPKHLNKSLKKLSKAQRNLSKKKKGSNNRRKQKVVVARIHEAILNQRNDFLHRVSTRYVSKYGFIAVENLNIKGLVNITYNARNIMSASWFKFTRMLEYKAERAGVQVIKVNPKGTTQQCSQCKAIVPKKLWHRIHKCACGFEADRDYNASLNILERGLRQVLPEVTPVEIEITQSRKQETTCVS